MKLLFKERVSLFGRYQVTNEQEEPVFEVAGEPSLLGKLSVNDASGRLLGQVRREPSLFTHRFRIDLGQTTVGYIEKKLTFFRPVFTLSMNDWRVEGNILEFDYRVSDSAGNTIMTTRKQLLSWMDAYEMEIPDPRNALLCLMIVLAIDLAKESNS